MSEIHILDSATIDKIAAGEVVERPVSVVKELVENSIDAGAKRVTVEIKDGGISMIRVTDDGSGIDKDQLHKVFYRHATSKIETAEDLSSVASLGFRGEALSSIGAVGQVELITKTEPELTGSRLLISGGSQEEITEVGAPVGTTIVVRNLFFNTPARKKFLKSAATEGSYIHEYMQHLAMAAPQVAFQFVMNSQTRFFTSGNGDLKEIIYRIYGKEVSSQLLPYEAQMEGVTIRGFLGRPILARANRTFETLFVNGRYIRSALLSSAIEEGYRTLLMQHKYPFVVLHFGIDPHRLDVNVHPTKLDIRISDPGELLKLLASTIAKALTERSLIQPLAQGDDGKSRAQIREEKLQQLERERQLTKELPQPFEEGRLAEESGYRAEGAEIRKPAPNAAEKGSEQEAEQFEELSFMMEDESGNLQVTEQGLKEDASAGEKAEKERLPKVLGLAMEPKGVSVQHSNIIKQRDVVLVQRPEQMELFDEVDIRQQEIDNFRIIGQVFDTYWILTMGDKLYYVDQHAAHEKIMYERLMKHYREKEIFAEPLNPPIILQLTPREAEVLAANKESFSALGFEAEPFGEDTYALRAVPMDLYGSSEKELFLSALDALMEGPAGKDADAVLFKIASMSCKAAVKGNSIMSMEEARALFTEMFRCDNPYHCPHGRPTMISMSKAEMEKKFHR